jgi:hypothetical protein
MVTSQGAAHTRSSAQAERSLWVIITDQSRAGFQKISKKSEEENNKANKEKTGTTAGSGRHM